MTNPTDREEAIMEDQRSPEVWPVVTICAVCCERPENCECPARDGLVGSILKKLKLGKP